MHYTLVQSNYKCHCGSGIYLGFKYYPQPYFLLAYAGKLKKLGHTVELIDLFLNKASKQQISGNVIVGTGEYAADVQYNYTLPKYQNAEYIGMHSWFNKNATNVILANELIGAEPAWELIDFDAYPKPNNRKRACLRLSLGCPNKCSYCPVPMIFKGKYYKYDIDWAKRQISELYNNYRIKEFAITDDNLFADMRNGKELLVWISENIKAHFFLQEGIEIKHATDEEFCYLLKKSNFYDIRLGVETLESNVLKTINKPYHNADDISVATSNLRAAGFKKLKAFLIQGLPGNNTQQEEDDIKILTSLGYKIRNHRLTTYNQPATQQFLMIGE